MKKTIFVRLVLIFTITYVFGNCNKNSNRAYFTINPNDRKILVPVQIDDGITGKFVFDTFYSVILDSTFCAAHPRLSSYNDTVNARQVQAGSYFSPKGMRNLIHEKIQMIKIGNSQLGYNHVQVYNLKGYMYNNELDGAFNIPQDDTTHVWELNFEGNYLEIHPEENFTMPENCFLFPMANDVYGDKLDGNNAIKVQLPIRIQCADGDTLTMNRICYIDTGMPWDIVLMYRAEELALYNRRNDAVWTEYIGSYYRHYEVKATLFDNFIMDSLRIYAFDRYSGIGDKYLIGLNFLKRFNVFFDMKNRRVGLQPINNFQRIVSPLARRFHYSTYQTPDGKIIITKVGDYKANYYKTAGLMEGDEIIAVNDKPYKEIAHEEKREFYTKDTLVFDIVREKQALKIVVPIDKNEVQGD